MTRIDLQWIQPPIGEGGDVEPDVVVWISIPAVETSFWRGDQWVGPRGIGAGQPSRYATMGRTILSGIPLRMADLSLDADGQILFTDGRHRFAWVRDHGAEALPVQTGPEQAEMMRDLYGTSLRLCEIDTHHQPPVD
jgi:hypothetical protein